MPSNLRSEDSVDPDTITVKYQGTTKRADQKTSALQGTFTVVGGKGEFDGINGEATFAGTQYSNGMYVSDWEAKATVSD